MSRIGKKPINLPQGVEAKAENGKITISGPKGKLDLEINPLVKVAVDNGRISVTVEDKSDRNLKALWGTMRSLVSNCVVGVSEGYAKKMDIVGVGYRAAADKSKLTLNLGYSHPIELAIPQGLEVKVEKSSITVSGIDKQLVGQFAAIVRSQREPEPYKGKGIKYSDEVIRRKAGKVVKAVGG